MATISPFRKQPHNVPPPGTAARAALAEAIAAHATAEARCAAAEAASQPLSEAVWAAQRKLEEATAAIAEAKTAAVQHLQAVALGTAGEPPQSIREARAALTDAEDVLQAARDTRDALKVQIPEDENRRSLTKGRLRDAALAVLKAEAGPMADALVAELTRLEREVASKGALLGWLVGEGIVEAGSVPEAPGSHRMMLGPARLALARYNSPPCTWHLAHAEMATVGAEPWKAALDALQRDANTALPT